MGNGIEGLVFLVPAKNKIPVTWTGKIKNKIRERGQACCYFFSLSSYVNKGDC